MNDEDVLLRALRELPAPPTDSPEEQRAHRAARSAFVRAHGRGGGRFEVADKLGRFVVPAVLACVVGVYLSWAIATVNALTH